MARVRHRLIGAAMLGLASADASAVPVVHDAGRSVVDGEPVAWSALRSADPATREGAPTRTCAGDPLTVVGLEARVAEVRGAVAYMEEARAVDLADVAIAALPCLAEPVPVELLGELLFLGGLAAHVVGRPTDPWAWRRAIAPSWDEAYGADGRDVFDAITPEPAALRVVAPEARAVLVDGRPPDAITAGPHLVQVDFGGRWGAAVVDVLAPTTTLVWPAAFPAALPSPADPADREALTDLLAVALGEGEAVRVLADDVAWEGTTGRTDWRPLAAPHVEHGERRGRPVLVGGIGVTALGGALAGLAYARASRADTDRIEAADVSAWEDADRRHRAAEVLYGVGWALVGVGAGGATVGLVARW